MTDLSETIIKLRSGSWIPPVQNVVDLFHFLAAVIFLYDDILSIYKHISFCYNHIRKEVQDDCWRVY